MARKKKINSAAEIQEISATPQKQSIGYQGKICIKTMRGNKIISTKNLKNTGMPDLFKFISHALAGNFYPDMQPCKIKLFNYTNSIVTAPSDFTWNTTDDFRRDASPYVSYDATPVVEKTTQGYATTFRFKIPSYWLFSDRYNMIGLFTNSDDPCAYYLFVDSTNVENNGWNPQILSEEHGTGNYSLIVEWTLEISNKK